MNVPIKLAHKVDLKNPPWNHVKILGENEALLLDDRNFALMNLKTGRINQNPTSFDRFRLDVVAIYPSTSNTHIIGNSNKITMNIFMQPSCNVGLLKSGDLLLYNLKTATSQIIHGLPEFKPPSDLLTEDAIAAPSTEDKVKRLFGIQQGSGHEFSTKTKTGVQLLDYAPVDGSGSILLVSSKLAK